MSLISCPRSFTLLGRLKPRSLVPQTLNFYAVSLLILVGKMPLNITISQGKSKGFLIAEQQGAVPESITEAHHRFCSSREEEDEVWRPRSEILER